MCAKIAPPPELLLESSQYQWWEKFAKRNGPFLVTIVCTMFKMV